MKTLYLFGDSILGGVELDETTLRYHKGEFAPESFLQNEELHTENLSRFGCTLPKAGERLDRCLENGEHFDFALIELGGNDCDLDWKAISLDPKGTHEPNTPLSAYREGLAKLIETLRAAGAKPILTRLPPIDADKYFAWVTRGLDAEAVRSYLGDVQQIYRHQEEYSDANVDCARSLHVPLVDLRRPFLSNSAFGHLFCTDGIHPNAAGHALLKDVLSRELLESDLLG